MLLKHASKAQIVVLTCRPRDYLLKTDMPKNGEAYATRAAGLVRAIDMSQLIERAQADASDNMTKE